MAIGGGSIKPACHEDQCVVLRRTGPDRRKSADRHTAGEQTAAANGSICGRDPGNFFATYWGMDKSPSPEVLRHDQLPSVACPHCDAHSTQVKSVATAKGESGVVNITMFCKDCKESWVVQKMTYHDEPPA